MKRWLLSLFDFGWLSFFYWDGLFDDGGNLVKMVVVYLYSFRFDEICCEDDSEEMINCIRYYL